MLIGRVVGTVVSTQKAPKLDGAKLLKMTPSWPGQYFWADKKTLQFRPAEPWPPLQRFASLRPAP